MYDIYFHLASLWDGWVVGDSFLRPVLTLTRSNSSFSQLDSVPLSLMIDNLKSHPPTPDQSPCLLPGFQVLSDFLAHHVHIPEVYLIVSTFFLQTQLTELMDGPKVGSWGSWDGVTHLAF